MEICMPTEDFDASSVSVAATPTSAESKAAVKTHPAPPMVWMLLPVALLALLAFLSR